MRLFPLLCLLPMLAALPAAHADTIIDNANGYTLNSKNQLIQFASFAFDDTGPHSGGRQRGPGRRQSPPRAHVDLRGKTVLSGLIVYQQN